MKKFISLTLVLIISFALVIPAFADGVGPFITEITARVINKNGAKAFLYSDSLEYEEEYGESDFAEAGYSSVMIPYMTELRFYDSSDSEELSDTPYFLTEYNGESVYVKGSDVSVTPVKPREENRYDPPLHFVVLSEEGEPLRSGPSNVSDILEIIPEGTEIEAVYSDVPPNPDETPGDYSVWSYTVYNGKSGWVNTGEEGTFGRFGKPVKYKEKACSPVGDYYAIDDIKLKDEPDPWNFEDAIGTIPAGTKGKFDYYVTYDHYGSLFVYLEYNGVKGWASFGGREVAHDNLMINRYGYMLVTDTMKLYKDDNLKPGEDSGKTVEPNQIIPFDYSYRKETGETGYSYNTFCRVTVDGEQYWACISDLFYKFNGCDLLKAKTDIDVYSGNNDEAEKLGTIPAGAVFLSLFTFNYVAYEDLRGWIFDIDNYDYVNISGDLLITPDEEGIKAALEKYCKPNSTGSDGVDEAQETTASEANPLAPESPNKTVIACVAAAAAAVVIASVGIARARKKKEE